MSKTSVKTNPSCGDTKILLRRHEDPLAATRRSSCGDTKTTRRVIAEHDAALRKVKDLEQELRELRAKLEAVWLFICCFLVFFYWFGVFWLSDLSLS